MDRVEDNNTSQLLLCSVHHPRHPHLVLHPFSDHLIQMSLGNKHLVEVHYSELKVQQLRPLIHRLSEEAKLILLRQFLEVNKAMLTQEDLCLVVGLLQTQPPLDLYLEVKHRNRLPLGVHLAVTNKLPV